MMGGREGPVKGQVVLFDTDVERNTVYMIVTIIIKFGVFCMFCCRRNQDVGVVLMIDGSCNRVWCEGVNDPTGQI